MTKSDRQQLAAILVQIKINRAADARNRERNLAELPYGKFAEAVVMLYRFTEQRTIEDLESINK